MRNQGGTIRTVTVESLDHEGKGVAHDDGKVIFVDYHRPHLSNPFRYVMVPILTTLEPFAMDMWRGEISEWLPTDVGRLKIEKQTYFGGLYQKVVITKAEKPREA